MMMRGAKKRRGQGEVAVDSVVSVWFTALTACGTNTANSGSDAGGNGEEEERGRWWRNHRSLCAASVKPQNLIPLSKSDKRAYLMQFCTAFNMTCPGSSSSRRKRGGGEGCRKVAGSLASLAVFAIIWRKLFACKLLFVRSQGYCEKPQFAAAQLPFTLNYNSADCIPGHGPHLAPPLLVLPLSLSALAQSAVSSFTLLRVIHTLRLDLSAANPLTVLHICVARPGLPLPLPLSFSCCCHPCCLQFCCCFSLCAIRFVSFRSLHSLRKIKIMNIPKQKSAEKTTTSQLSSTSTISSNCSQSSDL